MLAKPRKIDGIVQDTVPDRIEATAQNKKNPAPINPMIGNALVTVRTCPLRSLMGAAFLRDRLTAVMEIDMITAKRPH